MSSYHSKHDFLQRRLILLLRHRGIFCFSVPNGMFTSISQAKRHKDLGLVAGIPDICAIYSGVVLFIEIKTGAQKLSENQKKVVDILKNQGIDTILYRDEKKDLTKILNYFNLV